MTFLVLNTFMMEVMRASAAPWIESARIVNSMTNLAERQQLKHVKQIFPKTNDERSLMHSKIHYS